MDLVLTQPEHTFDLPLIRCQPASDPGIFWPDLMRLFWPVGEKIGTLGEKFSRFRGGCPNSSIKKWPNLTRVKRILTGSIPRFNPIRLGLFNLWPILSLKFIDPEPNHNFIFWVKCLKKAVSGKTAFGKNLFTYHIDNRNYKEVTSMYF